MCDEPTEEEMNAWVEAELRCLTPEKRESYDGKPPYWSVGADLRGAFGMPESNYPIRDLIEAKLVEHLPGLAERVDFDPEMSCFFAYTKSQEDGDDLVAFIIGLIAQGLQAA